MTLATGTTLGPYEILLPLGAGGMGEVYRARDTKLDREVAIKVLPELFSREPERVQRFEREAKVLASLNHPNIAAIYGFEEANEKNFLVMELVEGDTLAERIQQGLMPVEEALSVGRVPGGPSFAKAKGGVTMIGPGGPSFAKAKGGVTMIGHRKSCRNTGAPRFDRRTRPKLWPRPNRGRTGTSGSCATGKNRCEGNRKPCKRVRRSAGPGRERLCEPSPSVREWPNAARASSIVDYRDPTPPSACNQTRQLVTYPTRRCIGLSCASKVIA